MFDFLRRAKFEPIEFGPEAERSGGEIEVRSGPLAGRTIRLDAEVTNIKAVYRFSLDAEECGQCHFDRDPRTGLETLWDILIAPGFRGRGLASLMVRETFRDLLARSGRHWFGTRKLMKVDTRVPALHNIGIGIIAVRLGLRPEPLLDDILAPGVVESIELLSGENGGAGGRSWPPGLLIRLKRMPGLVVSARLDPRTGRPETDPDAYRRFTSPSELLKAARAGRALVGNIDYQLHPAQIELCCRHLARNAGEYRRWTRSLRSAAGRQKENT